MELRKTKERPIQIKQVAEITGYSQSYIYKLVHWKKIPYRKPNGKHGRLFFYESEILEFLSRNRIAADYEVLEQADTILNKE